MVYSRQKMLPKSGLQQEGHTCAQCGCNRRKAREAPASLPLCHSARWSSSTPRQNFCLFSATFSAIGSISSNPARSGAQQRVAKFRVLGPLCAEEPLSCLGICQSFLAQSNGPKLQYTLHCDRSGPGPMGGHAGRMSSSLVLHKHQGSG